MILITVIMLQEILSKTHKTKSLEKDPNNHLIRLTKG